MNNFDIDRNRRIAKHLTSIMTDNKPIEESADFKEWFNSNKESEELLEKFSEEKYLSDAYNKFSSYDSTAHLKEMKRKLRGRILKRRYLKLASVAAALTAITLLIWTNDWKNDKRSSGLINESDQMAQIKSAPSKQVLLIVNGDDTLSLGAKLTKSNKLTGTNANIKESNIENDKSSDKAMMNHLIVPRGNPNITVVLADGSSVILNAESELEYPSYFTGDKREVKLKGEAYFKVEKRDDKPFIVSVNDIKVTVYGTEFNINNYNSDIIETLLIKGSVGVKYNPDIKAEIILKPNQMLKTDRINFKNELNNIDDIERYISWMNGSFIYKADSLNKVLEDLSRCYDIDFKVHGKSNSAITAEFSKNSDITEIIKSLEITTGLKIDILPMEQMK